MNAGVMYEKAKQPENAADVYIELAEKYGENAPDIAEKAAFSAGQVYEKVIFYDRAAKAYELVVDKFGTGQQGGRRAVQRRRAAPGARPERRSDRALQGVREEVTRERKDAPDVAFNIGVVYEDAGHEGPAYQAFADYARTYRSTGKRIIEAHTRAGVMSLKLGQLKRAKDDFAHRAGAVQARDRRREEGRQRVGRRRRATTRAS